MRSLSSVALLASVSSALVCAAPAPSSTVSYPVPEHKGLPFVFPLSDGFPNNPNIADIEKRAGGTLPVAPANAAPGGRLSAEAITSLKYIAFNELFEAAFYTQLLLNVTNNVPGYEVPERIGRDNFIKMLTTVQAQEELHAINAQNALKANGIKPIQPCTYYFPYIDSLQAAMATAAGVTDMVLGTLQDIEYLLAKKGDLALVRGLASVIGQEGAQEGFYRTFWNASSSPSEAPFLTVSSRDFAFTTIQGFVIPGSCPDLITQPPNIPLKTFATLIPPFQNLNNAPVLNYLINTQDFTSQYFDHSTGYKWNPKADWSAHNSLHAVFVSGQNAPVVEKLMNVTMQGPMADFQVQVPKGLNNGMTIVALTANAGPFADVDAVTAATVFGPSFLIA